MSNLIDFIASLDWLDRVEGLVSNFRYANWARAKLDGIVGVTAELLETLFGTNRWTIWVPRDSDWSGPEIEGYLRHYGVVIWDRGFAGADLSFSVKERQANWAEYLLLRRGIPVTGPLYNPQNAVDAVRYAPGDAPPAWADGPAPSSSQDSPSRPLPPISDDEIRRMLKQ